MRIRILSGSGVAAWRRGLPRLSSRVWRACSVAAWAALCAGVFCAPNLGAKEKKIPRTVSGLVLDEADNGVSGAAVQLTDLRTGKKTAAYSKEGGAYQFSDLQPSHDYEVQAHYKGASSEVHQVSSVDTRNRIVINLTIPRSKP